jgi:hypothetical protein
VKKTEIRIQTWEVLVIRQTGPSTGENERSTRALSVKGTIPDMGSPACVKGRTLSLSSWINGLFKKGQCATSTHRNQASRLRPK